MADKRGTDVKYNLLDEPLLGVEGERGQRSEVTLPELLARLSRGEHTELTALQAHQQHPWHAFTVQLAALALSHAKQSAPPHDAAAWRALLEQRAKHDAGGPEAFALVVDDLSKPAFMQPPVPEGRLAALKNVHDTPSSELDVLITAKNHDLKMDRLARPTPEHWAFALVTLQTMQGFLGAGNYGIARMNGGFSSRPCVAFASDQAAAARFARDLPILLEARSALLERHGFCRKGEVGLVWCAAWDGKSALDFEQLDPHFIEICRRIRLSQTARGNLVAHRGSSKCARIAASEANGYTGDAWTPVARKDGKALTLAETGFGYDRVQDLLLADADWQHGSAGVAGAARGDRYWVGQALVRGQGKTGGYHERWLSLPPKGQRILAAKDARARLGERAKAWVGFARDVRLKVLKPAVLTLLQGAPEKLKFDDGRAEPNLRSLDRAIDQVFFETLFEHADASAEAADAGFQKVLFDLARRELDHALTSVPLSSARRPRAIAKATAVFAGAARNCLKLAFASNDVAASEATTTEGGAA